MGTDVLRFELIGVGGKKTKISPRSQVDVPIIISLSFFDDNQCSAGLVLVSVFSAVWRDFRGRASDLKTTLPLDCRVAGNIRQCGLWVRPR